MNNDHVIITNKREEVEELKQSIHVLRITCGQSSIYSLSVMGRGGVENLIGNLLSIARPWVYSRSFIFFVCFHVYATLVAIFTIVRNLYLT